MRRGRVPPTRCRNSLFWGAGLFLLLQIACSVGLDLFAPLARFPSARAVLRQAELGSDLVFLGSSRFGASLDTAEIQRLLRGSLSVPCPRVLNAAVPAGDAISAEFLLDQLLVRGGRPSWVVLELSPENLNFPGPWLGAQVMRQLGWREVPTHFVETVQSNDGLRYFGSLLLPTHVHRDRLLEAIVERWQPPPRCLVAECAGEPIEWRTLLPSVEPAASEDHRERLHPGAVAARRWLRNYQIGGQTTLALRRLLQRCQAESIAVVLLIPPLASGHREEYLEPIESAFQHQLQKWRSEFACQVVDARDWLPDAMFRDASHPSMPEGQLRFSRLLTQRVLLNLIQPRTVAQRVEAAAAN